MSYQAWLDKATENLTAAQLCLDHGLFNACANRLYYAMFHAGAAALLKNGFKPASEKIGHEWLQSNFSGQLIHRRKIFSGKFRPFINDAYWLRVAADYKADFVARKTVLRQLERAKEFIHAIKQELSYDAQS